MKHIRKGKEPKSLTSHRCKADSTYDNYLEKDDLRESLLKEQGYICCYCMEQINSRNMKIEHWHSQSKYPNEQLNYRNLLAACMGSEGGRKDSQHCDTRKGDKDITINPTNKDCEILIEFSDWGEIFSKNEQINKDLDKTLNLNNQTLIDSRMEALNEALDDFKKRHAGQWTKEILEREISRWSSSIQGVYKRYCQIVVYYFRKKLSKR